MANNSGAWTKAIENRLQEAYAADSESWVSIEELLTLGASQVPDERALKDAKGNQARIQVGRRSAAQQGLNGLLRFHKARRSVDKKSVQWVPGGAKDLGPVVHRVDILEATVEDQGDQIEALTAQVQFLMDKLTGETDKTAEQFLASVGLNSSE